MSKETVLHPGEQLCLCDEYSVPVLTRVYQPIPITYNFRIFSTLTMRFDIICVAEVFSYVAQLLDIFAEYTYMDISLISPQNLSSQISPASSGDHLSLTFFFSRVQRISWDLWFICFISCKFAWLISAGIF